MRNFIHVNYTMPILRSQGKEGRHSYGVIAIKLADEDVSIAMLQDSLIPGSCVSMHVTSKVFLPFSGYIHILRGLFTQSPA